jgi:hypothetical protein
MSESAYQREATGDSLRQPWGTLTGMLAACVITLWCVAHDFPVNEILSRSLCGGLVTACVFRCWTFSWSVFFPKS